MITTFLYGNASQQFATKVWNWPLLRVSGLLVDATYAPRINVDKYVSDIPAGAVIARSNALGAYMASQFSVNGVCSGLLPQFDAVLWPTPAVALVLYVDTGVDGTSSLIYYSADGVGFPLVVDGFNYYIAPNLVYGGWFQV
ncbi:MAG TPA: hypothetical protein VIJ38_02100 [Acidobacteriaceae bacterium]